MTRRTKVVAGLAGVASAAAIAMPMFSQGTGSVDVFVGSTPTSTATPDPCPGLSFCDEFSGSSLDTTKWVAVDNTIGNTNSFQCVSAGQVSVAGGLLTETDTAGSFTCPGPSGGNGSISSGCPSACAASWKDGEIQTRDFAFKYGTVEVKAQVTGGNPVWPAIWLLGKDCQHPQYLVNGDDPAPCSWFSTGSEEIDMPDWPGGTVGATTSKWNEYTDGDTPNTCSGSLASDVSTAQHTYAMTWTSSSISFKYDGSTVSGCTTTTHIPSAPEFLIIDAAMNANGTPTRSTLDVDYVHITVNGPNATVMPSISGSTVHGNVLTADHGTWTGSPTGYTYQWTRCNSSGLACSLISGATSSTYTTQVADEGHQVQVLVTATNAAGATQYGSTPVGPIS